MSKVTITSLAVANLGPFREQQDLDLRVRGQRPVVLVKALNGSGKTTLLTALQIGLYGQKALHSARRSEYEQMVLALLRADATGKAFVEVGISVESAQVRQEYVVRREWAQKADGITEELTVFIDGGRDLDLSQTWDEFIEGILPAELVQLFFFDGEKIEALANPERLPDLLRRATEVFLGIGGIDALGNDLKAVERRAALKSRGESSEFDAAASQLSTLDQQVSDLDKKRSELRNSKAAAVNAVEQAHSALEKFTTKAQRKGLSAYQAAARIRNAVVESREKVTEVRAGLAELMSDPVLPVRWLGAQWQNFESVWTEEVRARQARQMAAEFKRRDSRVLKILSDRAPAAVLGELRTLLAEDIREHFGGRPRKAVGLQDADPAEFSHRAAQQQHLVRNQLELLQRARRAADRAEQEIGQIPAEEQMGEDPEGPSGVQQSRVHG